MRADLEKQIEAFRHDLLVQGLSELSVKRYAVQVRIMGEYLEEHEKSFTTMTRQDLVEFISYIRIEKNMTQKTLKNYFAGWNSFFEYLLFNEEVQANLIPIIRKRYLKQYKRDEGTKHRRKVISAEEMSKYLNSIMNIRNQAIAVLLVKTGVRRGELVNIDLSDIDWGMTSIKLKDKRKRSNLHVFFDEECADVLRYWLKVRESLYLEPGCDALFTNNLGRRLNRHGVYNAVAKSAEKFGIHDSKSKNNEDHFTPHCLRHCFTTYLLESGMNREYVKELRGDARRDAVDVYNHIPLDKLREAYLSAIPQFGL